MMKNSVTYFNRTDPKLEYEKIYIYFVRRYKEPFWRNLLSKLIKFFSKPKYSHVGVIIDEYLTSYYNPISKLKQGKFNEIFIVESIGKSDGVVFTTLNQNNRYAYIDVYSLVCPKSKKYQFIESLMKEFGKKYDYRAFFSFVFKFLKQVPSRWYCSELVAVKLKEIGFKFQDTKRISPSDLYYQLIDYNLELEAENIFIEK